MRVLFAILISLCILGVILWDSGAEQSQRGRGSSVERMDSVSIEEQSPPVRIQKNLEPEGRIQQLAEPAKVKTSSLSDCLRKPNFQECLSGYDLSVLSPIEIAQMLEDSSISGTARSTFLAGVMLTLGTWNFASSLDEVYSNMSGRRISRYGIFESAMRRLAENNEEWVSWIAEGISEKEVFAVDRSELIVVILSGIPNMPERLDQILFRGAHGELGGSSQQVSRAYNLYQYKRCDSSQEGFEFAQTVISSPNLSDEASYDIAQLSLHYIGRIAGSGDLSEIEVEGFLRTLFDNQRFQLGTAAQFLRDYPDQAYPGLSEEVSGAFLLEAQGIMDSEMTR